MNGCQVVPSFVGKIIQPCSKYSGYVGGYGGTQPEGQVYLVYSKLRQVLLLQNARLLLACFSRPLHSSAVQKRRKSFWIWSKASGDAAGAPRRNGEPWLVTASRVS